MSAFSSFPHRATLDVPPVASDSNHEEQRVESLTGFETVQVNRFRDHFVAQAEKVLNGSSTPEAVHALAKKMMEEADRAYERIPADEKSGEGWPGASD